MSKSKEWWYVIRVDNRYHIADTPEDNPFNSEQDAIDWVHRNGDPDRRYMVVKATKCLSTRVIAGIKNL